MSIWIINKAIRYIDEFCINRKMFPDLHTFFHINGVKDIKA